MTFLGSDMIPVRAEIRDVWLTGVETRYELKIQISDSLHRPEPIDLRDGVVSIPRASFGWIEKRVAANVIFSTWRSATERRCA